MQRVSLLLALFALALTPPLRAQGGPPLAVLPSAAEVEAGATFTLSIVAGSASEPVDSLFGVGFELGYDAAAFDVDSAHAGPFLRQGLSEGATLIVFDDRIDRVPAPFSVTRVRPHPGTSGHGTVAVFPVAL